MDAPAGDRNLHSPGAQHSSTMLDSRPGRRTGVETEVRAVVIALNPIVFSEHQHHRTARPHTLSNPSQGTLGQSRWRGGHDQLTAICSCSHQIDPATVITALGIDHDQPAEINTELGSCFDAQISYTDHRQPRSGGRGPRTARQRQRTRRISAVSDDLAAYQCTFGEQIDQCCSHLEMSIDTVPIDTEALNINEMMAQHRPVLKTTHSIRVPENRTSVRIAGLRPELSRRWRGAGDYGPRAG